MSNLSPEAQEALRAYCERLALFMTGESDKCLHCETPVSYAEKQGRSVYAYPCGCRMYQGSVPKWLQIQQSN